MKFHHKVSLKLSTKITFEIAGRYREVRPRLVRPCDMGVCLGYGHWKVVPFGGGPQGLGPKGGM